MGGRDPQPLCCPAVDPDYAVDSPNWDAWSATEHDVRCRGSFDMKAHAPPPPVVVKEEDEEEEAAYVATL